MKWKNVKMRKIKLLNDGMHNCKECEIRSIKSLYKTALIEGRYMAKERRKKIEENKGH